MILEASQLCYQSNLEWCLYHVSFWCLFSILNYKPCHKISLQRSKMALNYRVIVERYPFPNEVVRNTIPTMKLSPYLTEKTSQVGRKPRAHPPQSKQQTPPCTKKILKQGGANRLKFTSDCLTLVIYLFLKLSLHHFYVIPQGPHE
jgi:hypothetical protein